MRLNAPRLFFFSSVYWGTFNRTNPHSRLSQTAWVRTAENAKRDRQHGKKTDKCLSGLLTACNEARFKSLILIGGTINALPLIIKRSAMLSIRIFLAAVFFTVCAYANAAPTITVVPGTGFSYLPLDGFGVSPQAGMGDESAVNVNVPTYSYGGQSWNRVGVSSNGYVVVGGMGVGDTSTGQAIPNPALPNNVLAPFWTDLNPSLTGGIHVGVLTDGVNNWLIVDWAGVANASGPGVNSFEVWIGLNGVEDIWFAYGDVTSGNLGQLTIGAEDSSGTAGAMAYYNGVGTLPTAGTILRVTTSDSPVTEIPEPGSLALLGLGLVGLAASRKRKQA